MAILDRTCSSCGQKMDRGAGFCPSCGQPTGRGKLRCGHCGADMTAGAGFCGSCGRPASETARPTVEDGHWARSSEDFATRIDVHDLKGIIRKQFTVEAGTQAILLADGRNEAGRVGPGKHTVENLLTRFATLGNAKAVTVIVVDGGDTTLEFQIEKLYTRDPVAVTMECSVAVQIDNPALFLTNVMKGASRFSQMQLRNYVFDELRNAAEEAVGNHTVEELGARLQLKQEFEIDILAHLSRTFERAGLHFDRVRTLNYYCEVLDRQRGARHEYALLATEQETKTQKRDLLFEGEMDERVHELVRETAEVALFEKRAAILDRMRQATLSDRMNEVNSEEEWAKYMQSVNRDRVIRDDEMERLRKEYAERMQDRDVARAHQVALLNTERDLELEKARLRSRFSLDDERFELETALARKRLEATQALDEQELRYLIERERKQKDAERAQRELDDIERRQREIQDAQAENEVKLANARTQAEVNAIEREEDRLDAEMGILLLERMKAVRRRDDEERLRIEIDAEERRLRIELERKRTEVELMLKAEAEQARMELERMRAMADMSVESLIAISNSEQAGLLAELKRTEALRDFSEEQILAMAAEKSPEVAEAFKEKFKAIAATQGREQIEALYERLVQEQSAGAAEARQAANETARRMQEMFDKALDSQRETATAFAGGRSDPVIVVPGAGPQGGYGRAGAGGAQGDDGLVVCRRCGRKSSAGARFCENCGYEFWSSEGK
jgi:hypothetical protein